MGFDGYEDAETRRAMVEFVARRQGIDPGRAEGWLRSLDHVGLAYLRRDLLDEQTMSTTAIADYDPVWGGNEI